MSIRLSISPTTIRTIVFLRSSFLLKRTARWRIRSASSHRSPGIIGCGRGLVRASLCRTAAQATATKGERRAKFDCRYADSALRKESQTIRCDRTGCAECQPVVTDRWLQCIVLDMGSLALEYVARIELSTWHRYRLAAERTQSSILLLSQYPCAKSSSELQLRLSPAEESDKETTLFAGMQPGIEVVRQHFTQAESNVVPLRKPPQNVHTASWSNRTTWAVRR